MMEAMKSFVMRLSPRSAFGTPIFGDTLFGQLCWAIRNRLGNDRLDRLLHGYTEGRPFAVASDAFPAGFVPRPALPVHWFHAIDGLDRKAAKKKIWIPVRCLEKPIERWLEDAKTPLEVTSAANVQTFCEEHEQPHNSISRLTGTTGEGFAPYTQPLYWYAPETELECYWLLDEERLDVDALKHYVEDIGHIGFGRDASIGLGKYRLESFEEFPLSIQPSANACMTLAPCAPQGLGFDPKRSFYHLFTRFGRHGDSGVHKTGQPFKNPVLLAKSGAIFALAPPETGWIGQGLGGNGLLSKTIPETVQQGYSPVIPIHLPRSTEDQP
jgi:CRISPR-associated protein Csm4